MLTLVEQVQKVLVRDCGFSHYNAGGPMEASGDYQYRRDDIRSNHNNQMVSLYLNTDQNNPNADVKLGMASVSAGDRLSQLFRHDTMSPNRANRNWLYDGGLFRLLIGLSSHKWDAALGRWVPR